jgi:tRNA C32,U32 (ribose-2'-O)-methylase TrmJ
MFNRIQLEHKEVQIMRGICSAIENAIRQKQD